MDNIGYELEEMTLISILLFSEKATIDDYNKVFEYTSEDMIFDYKTKALYKVIKEQYKDNADILGNENFTYKVSCIMEIEYKVPQTFILEIQNHWMPIQVLDRFIKQVQERYFDEEFKKANSEEDFNKILSLKDKFTLTNEMVDIASDASIFITDYEKRRGSAIFTNYPSIDEVVGSLQGGDMVVLAGGTGGGKTCFMLNLIMQMAQKGKKIDVFSLEMPKLQLQQRMICAGASIDASKFRKFTLTNEDKKRYNDYANNEFKKLNIRIYKNQTISIERIKAIEAKSDADIVFIDYLGLINSYSNKGAYERFSEISRNIKLTAMSCNKPIIALHQLNREFQNREDKTPKLSDIRDSGKIEQDADMVWLIHRPYIYEPEKYDQNDIRLMVAKNRHGVSNREVKLKFNGVNQRITEPIIK